MIHCVKGTAEKYILQSYDRPQSFGEPVYLGCDLCKWLSASHFLCPPFLVLAGRLEGTGIDISLLLHGGLVGARFRSSLLPHIQG